MSHSLYLGLAGAQDMVQLLIDAGSSVTITNKDGKTPTEVAKLNLKLNETPELQAVVDLLDKDVFL
mgnify:FL=1